MVIGNMGIASRMRDFVNLSSHVMISGLENGTD